MQENNYCVYKHTAPNGKVYIGITRRKPVARWGTNGNRYCNNKHFFYAIQKYGWDNIKHEILYDGLDAHTAGEYEKWLIFFYRSADRRFGYNNTYGGEHGKMATHVNDENRWRGKQLIGEKNPFYGKKHSASTKAHLSQVRLNNPNRFELSRMAGLKAKEKTQKPVYQYDLNGYYLGSFQSCVDAVFFVTGNKRGGNHIGAVCAGIRKTAYGYQWRFDYLGKKIDGIKKEYRHGAQCSQSRAVIQYDLNGKYIKTFLTVTEAAQEVGNTVACSNICACAKGRKSQAYGYIWKYADKEAAV